MHVAALFLTVYCDDQHRVRSCRKLPGFTENKRIGSDLGHPQRLLLQLQ